MTKTISCRSSANGSSQSDEEEDEQPVAWTSGKNQYTYFSMQNSSRHAESSRPSASTSLHMYVQDWMAASGLNHHPWSTGGDATTHRSAASVGVECGVQSKDLGREVDANSSLSDIDYNLQSHERYQKHRHLTPCVDLYHSGNGWGTELSNTARGTGVCSKIPSVVEVGIQCSFAEFRKGRENSSLMNKSTQTTPQRKVQIRVRTENILSPARYVNQAIQVDLLCPENSLAKRSSAGKFQPRAMRNELHHKKFLANEVNPLDELMPFTRKSSSQDRCIVNDWACDVERVWRTSLEDCVGGELPTEIDLWARLYPHSKKARTAPTPTTETHTVASPDDSCAAELEEFRHKTASPSTLTEAKLRNNSNDRLAASLREKPEGSVEPQNGLASHKRNVQASSDVNHANELLNLALAYGSCSSSDDDLSICRSPKMAKIACSAVANKCSAHVSRSENSLLDECAVHNSCESKSGSKIRTGSNMYMHGVAQEKTHSTERLPSKNRKRALIVWDSSESESEDGESTEGSCSTSATCAEEFLSLNRNKTVAVEEQHIVADGQQTENAPLTPTSSYQQLECSPIEEVPYEKHVLPGAVKQLCLNSRRRHRVEFTEEDRRNIVHFLITQDGSCQNVGGNEIWKKMEIYKVCPGHTWQSTKEHFRKRILPSLDLHGQTGQNLKKYLETI